MTALDDRVARFEADIVASPAALAGLLDTWRTPDLGGRSRIVLSGLGSSRYAALVVSPHVRAGGGTAWVEHASTSVPTAPSEDLVFVAISASGRTHEVLAAADHHRGRSLVVAVTNAPDSRLAALADIVIPLRAGEETAGIACRTFRATVAALALLTGAATRDDLRPAVDALADRIGGRDAWLPDMTAHIADAPSIDVLADASLLGASEQAALMLREAPRLPARAYDTADWLHTGVYLALPGHRVLLFPGTAADQAVIETVRRRGGEVVSVATAGGGALARAVEESVVAELVAAEAWRRTTAHDKGA